MTLTNIGTNLSKYVFYRAKAFISFTSNSFKQILINLVLK